MKKKSLFEDDEFYVNDAGLYVFTEAFLLERGYCCGNGCLHCPYNFKNVVDLKKRTKLLESRAQASNNLPPTINDK